MGLFDLFKKKEVAPAPSPAPKAQQSALHQVLDKLKKSQGSAVMAELSRVLKAYVDDALTPDALPCRTGR